MENINETKKGNFVMSDSYENTVPEAGHEEEYYEPGEYSFRKKSILPFVLAGVGFLVLVVLGVILLTRTPNASNNEQLSDIEARLEQIEKQLSRFEGIDRNLARFDAQEKEFEQLADRFGRFEANMAGKLDEINKELSGLKKKATQSPPSKTQLAKPATAPPARKTYEVRAGDTLYQISRRHGLTVNQLRAYNNIGSNNYIHPGQKLFLSPPGGN
ncbi:MAG: LysM peptidoglycan-binding domain-containing protein [Desulfobacterales bacterium]|nr:MAG: LysM peptidoglycan-binding domain-containing protein [Desulfobacterales bacterium]